MHFLALDIVQKLVMILIKVAVVQLVTMNLKYGLLSYSTILKIQPSELKLARNQTYFRKLMSISSQFQGQIQTTSTYANAEVTSSVVKLLKNTGIPIFSTKLLSSFLLPIEEIRSLRPRVGRGYSAVVVERLCMSAMR